MIVSKTGLRVALRVADDAQDLGGGRQRESSPALAPVRDLRPSCWSAPTLGSWGGM